MAYIEVRENGKLTKRVPVDTEKALRGCSIKVGSLGEVLLALGESATLGHCEIRIVEDVTIDDTVDATQPAGAGQPRDDRHYATISDTKDTQKPAPPGEVPQIEGYQITAKLGEGGMGTVWRAVQLGTRREVALKLLGSGAFGSDKARMRFEREVEFAARLEHPNIARVYESGLHHNMHYYAMELIDGVHLDEYVETNNLLPRQIMELVETISEAVQYAHQRGVIHRDLKPSNIMVTEDGKPCVLDFGLAKPSSEDDDAVTISAPGDVAGTPAYMSPEQAAGRIDQIDTRTDVYSLGVILYRLLTHQYPHELSGTRYEVLRRIAEEEVKRPRDVSKKIDKELEALLLKALAHDSSDRYASAGDLAADITNYLTGEPLTAKAPTTMYFLRKRLRKYRVPVAITAVVLAALIGMAVYAYVNVTWERDRALTAKRAEEEQRQRADAEAQKTKQEAEQNRRALYLAQVSLAAREYEQCNDSAARRLLDACPEDLRGWEWGHLSSNLASAFVGLDHKSVTWASFSPKGKHLLTLSDQSMYLWDTNTGRRLWSSAIGARAPVIFTPDGETIISSSTEGKLVEWDVHNRKVKSTIENARCESDASLVITADGKLIALAGDNVIHVLERSTGKILMKTEWRGARSDYIAFSKDAEKVSAISVTKNIWAEWNVRTGKEIRTGKIRQANERLLAISSDLTQIAVAATSEPDGNSMPSMKIVILEIPSRRHICDISDYDPGMSAEEACSFSSGGKQFLIRGGWAIKGYDLGNGKRLFRLRKSELMSRMGADLAKTITAVKLKAQQVMPSPYCRSVALIIKGKAYLVRTERGGEHFDMQAMNMPVSMVKFSPEDRTLAAFGMYGGKKPEIKFWSMGPPNDTWTIDAGAPQSPIFPVMFTPDGQAIVAMNSAFKGLSKIDIKSGRIVGGYKMGSGFGAIQEGLVSYRTVAYSPGGKELVWGRMGQCHVWDAASGQKLRTIKSDKKAAFVCSNGALAITVQNFSYGSDKQGRATVVNLTTGETICDLTEQIQMPVTISKDGRWVLALMKNWSMGVVSAQTGKVQCVLSGLKVPPENRFGMAAIVSPMTLNAFSPDGERIVTGGAGGNIHLWDTQTGTRILSLAIDRMIAMRLSFSPGGKYIAAGLGDGRVRLWAAHTKAKYPRFGKTKAIALGLTDAEMHFKRGRAYSRVGKYTDAIGAYKKAIAIRPNHGWAHFMMSLAYRLRGQRDDEDAGHAAYREAKRLLGKEKLDSFWNSNYKRSERELLTLKGHSGNVWSVVFSPDGKRLASGSGDNTIKLWDSVTGKELLTLKGSSVVRGFIGVSLQDKGERTIGDASDLPAVEGVLITGVHKTGPSERAGIRAGDFVVNIGEKRIENVTELVNHVATLRPGKFVKITFYREGKAKTVTVRIAERPNKVSVVFSVAFSPDGKRLASGSRDKTIKLWDASTGEEFLALKGHPSAVRSLTFSPDGKRLASGSGDRTIKLWDTATGKELFTLKGHSQMVHSIAFSPNGIRLASGSKDKTIKLWDASTGRELLTLKGHSSDVLSVAFSPDGKRLASGSWDKTIKLWDAATGTELHTLKGLRFEVYSVAFSPDGKRLASGGGTVEVWDSVTGKGLFALSGPGAVLTVAFSPDGKYLASGNGKTVKIWDILNRSKPSELLEKKKPDDAAKGVVYAKGNLEATLKAKPLDIENAAGTVFAKMGIRIDSIISSSKASGRRDGEILGSISTDKAVFVKIKSRDEKISVVSIRVGTFGDEDLSRIILDGILKTAKMKIWQAGTASDHLRDAIKTDHTRPIKDVPIGDPKPVID